MVCKILESISPYNYIVERNKKIIRTTHLNFAQSYLHFKFTGCAGAIRTGGAVVHHVLDATRNVH